MIGCITVLAWAVVHRGDYLVCRQFMPQLRDTTYKVFKEICPKELILEERIAESTIRIKCVGGGYSNVMFRGLEEPEKHLSLTLNGFFIDENNQVSYQAFEILQGRLRGRHLRKGILTGNPAGHDWSWKLFVEKDFKDQATKDLFFSIKAPTTENAHLSKDYIDTMLNTWSEDRIQRFIYASEDAFEGQVYADFRRDLHVVKPFRIPDDWDRHIRIDHGYRNPAAVLFFAVNREGEVFLYREFYEREWLISEIINGKKEAAFRPGIKALAKCGQDGAEIFQTAKIDPSTKNRSGRDGTSDFDEYHRHWPQKFPPLGFAKNDVQVGVERVKQYLKPHAKTGKPLLYIFENCKNTLSEIATYKYPELSPGQSDKKAEPEKPLKVNDHACLVLGTLVDTISGPKAIEEIKVGDMVLTSLGYRPVVASMSSGLKAVLSVPLSNGRILHGTADHPILTTKGKIALSGLKFSDELIMVPSWLGSYSTASFLGKSVTIIDRTAANVRTALSRCTEKFGSIISDQFQTATTFITKMATPITTRQTISNACLQGSTQANMPAGQPAPRKLLTFAKSERWQRNGIRRQMASNGIGNRLSKLQRRFFLKPIASARTALFAAKNLLPGRSWRAEPSFATPTAGPQLCGVAEVWNLAVDGVSEYFAEGVLVSNCDALRYMIVDLPDPTRPPDPVEKTKPNSIERRLSMELMKVRHPTQKDPWKDF